MNKAYIILAHHQIAQLCRLLNRLDDSNSFFFLHIDKKVSIEDFRNVLELFAHKIKLVDRVSIEWAGFGLVEATLNAMYQIKKDAIQFDWILLISGQDYPIKTNDYISAFLNDSLYAGYLEYTTLPDNKRWSPRGGYYRIDKYFMGFKKIPRLTAKGLNFLSRFVPLARRPVIKNFTHYAGSQWWIMNRELLEYTINYIDKNPDYYTFHKHTFAADEVFFHSILLNASGEIKMKVKNDNMRYYNWPDTSKSHPETLELKNFDELKRSEALFARKFDMKQHPSLIDLVDQNCLKSEKDGSPVPLDDVLMSQQTVHL